MQQLDNHFLANFTLTVEVKSKDYADGHELHNEDITYISLHCTSNCEDEPIEHLQAACLQWNSSICRKFNSSI